MQYTLHHSKLWSLAAWGVLALATSGCERSGHEPPNHEPLLALVAASTSDAMNEIAVRFTKQYGTPVKILPGPSSALVKQFVNTEQADLFLSADDASAEMIEKAGLVAESRNLLTNVLVVAVPSGSELKLATLAELDSPHIKRIAIPEAGVPSGEYARQSLHTAGILNAVKSRLIAGTDVRATLQLVARREADAGFVYRTDTLGNAQVRVAFEVPAAMHRPIVYRLLLMRKTRRNPASWTFYGYLASREAGAIFEKHGFGMAAASASVAR